MAEKKNPSLQKKRTGNTSKKDRSPDNSTAPVTEPITGDQASVPAPHPSSFIKNKTDHIYIIPSNRSETGRFRMLLNARKIKYKGISQSLILLAKEAVK
jgi:hypothetical protein